jgi:Aspartyl protease
MPTTPVIALRNLGAGHGPRVPAHRSRAFCRCRPTARFTSVAWLLSLAVFSGSCAEPTPIRVIDLKYDSALAAAGFPSPVIRVSVQGHAAWLLVDTGAGVHTLAQWFVAAAGIASREAKGTAQGTTGNKVSLRRTDRIALQLQDGSTLDLNEAAIASFPSTFTQLQIGGLVSPQLLAAANQVVTLDLRKPQLSLRDPRSVAKGIGTFTKACHNAESEFANRLYSADAKVSGTSGTLTIDSGATSTLISRRSKISVHLLPFSKGGAQVRGVGGEAESVRRIAGVKVERGGTLASLDVLLGDTPASCGRDGLLGMDSLRSCVVTMGSAGAVLACN